MPRFNDSLSTRLTDEQRRARYGRGARNAKITNRASLREQAVQPAAPPPTTRRIVDPLALTDHLSARKVSEVEKAEQEWRARLSREAIQRDLRADMQKTSKPRQAARVPPAVIGGVYVPRRAAALARLAMADRKVRKLVH